MVKHCLAMLAALLVFTAGCSGLGFKACVVPAKALAEYVQDDAPRAICYQMGAGFDSPKPVTIEEAK